VGTGCDQEVAGFKVWARLRASPEYGADAPPGVALVAIPGLAAPCRAEGTVVVTRDRDVGAMLAEARKLLGPAGARLGLLVAPDVPWQSLVRLTDELRAAGAPGVCLLFTAAASAEPARSPLGEALAGARSLPEDRRAAAAAALLAPALAHCPPAARLLGRPGDASPRDRAYLIAFDLPEAVAACRCALDVPSAEAILWSMRPSPILVGPWLRLDGPPIAAPADLPWSEAHRKLLERKGGGARLVIAP
jgi:hypothetical protein